MITVQNLHPYYQYMCVVAAYTSVGVGPFSPALTQRTAEDGQFELLLT